MRVRQSGELSQRLTRAWPSEKAVLIANCGVAPTGAALFAVSGTISVMGAYEKYVGRKYRRLLVVAFIPLMLMGIIASFTFFRVDHYSNILCNQPLPGYDNCRSVGEPEGNLYKRVKGEHAAWFSIEWEPYNDNPLQYIFAEANSRTIADVEITGTKPYVGQGRDADIFMQTLVGKPGVALQLGAERGESSMIAERFALLTCHTLEIYPENSSYSAHCFGNGWGGVLEFSPSGEGAVALNQLVDSVNKVRDEEYIGAIIYYAVVWPFFVYIFLIGSLLWWIATKAFRFVKAG